MKKPLKVLSSAALLSVFTASSIVPVAAATVENVESVSFDTVILEKDGQYFAIDKETYYNEKLIGTEFAPFTIVQSSEGKLYKKDDFYDYKLITDNLTEAFNSLDEDKKALDIPKVGKAVVDEDGNVQYIEDDQPEDRLNETFFYNFVA